MWVDHLAMVIVKTGYGYLYMVIGYRLIVLLLVDGYVSLWLCLNMTMVIVVIMSDGFRV